MVDGHRQRRDLVHRQLTGRDKDVNGGGLSVGRAARVVARVLAHHLVDDESTVGFHACFGNDDDDVG